MTALTSLLGIHYPIIQAPMAGVQDSALAIAVCQAGGLGSLPCAMLAPEAVLSEASRIRAHTDRPFNLNFFCHTPLSATPEALQRWAAHFRNYRLEWGMNPDSAVGGSIRVPFSAAMAQIVEQIQPAVVSFHFGLPAPDLLERVRKTGAVIVSSATTVGEARWLEANGADVIIAQGLEAGGHRGMFLDPDPRGALTQQTGLFALLPQILDAVKIPVVAAGGIADANGVRAALGMGASGVQVGTAYLLCDEAKTSAVHRAALQSPDAQHTALTTVFTGRPARGIVNRLMRGMGYLHPDAPPFPLAGGASAELRTHAEAAGNSDFSPLWAGQNVSGCKPIPAGVLTRQLISGIAV